VTCTDPFQPHILASLLSSLDICISGSD
jgi:hypothetical protein